MTKLSDFLEQQKAYNDQMDAFISAVSNDVNHLHDVILNLQDSLGSISPEDQLVIDQLQKQSKDLLNKMSSIDNLTPPPTPSA